MPTYEPADDQVIDLAKEILNRYESHAPLLKHKVKFDFVFAHPTVDENGEAHRQAEHSPKTLAADAKMRLAAVAAPEL